LQNNHNIWFLNFLNFRKDSKFEASIEHPKAKIVSASGGLCPLTPRSGALLLDPVGGTAPDLQFAYL